MWAPIWKTMIGSCHNFACALKAELFVTCAKLWLDLIIWIIIRAKRSHITISLHWRHNECNGVSNFWRVQCLLKRLVRCRSKKTSKLHVTGLCEGNSPRTDEFPAQMVSNAENVSIWWRHHGNASPVTLYDITGLGLTSLVIQYTSYKNMHMKMSAKYLSLQGCF